MAFVRPRYTKGEVNRAGAILATDYDPFTPEGEQAAEILANWRGCHAYPINTFQATLRAKLRDIDSNALVAQRLKKAPSIVAKLQRFDGMQLARMQDIGGLRAVVSSMRMLHRLVANYNVSRLAHERLSSKNYIDCPKHDGYRSIHLIYRYKNKQVPDYDGLTLELQIRTKIQHAWATAVETMGTYLGQALKSGQGDAEWKEFFRTASASLALIERSAPVPGFERANRDNLFAELAQMAADLDVVNKLRSFAIATERIHTDRGSGAYHLIVLNSKDRSVALTPYSLGRLQEATEAYAKIEERAKNGEPLDAVLVSAGPIEALKKAYPNYFLDTQVFIQQLSKIIREVARGDLADARIEAAENMTLFD